MTTKLVSIKLSLSCFMLVQLSLRAKRLNRECLKELQILISMVRRVDVTSKIVMMSDDEVLVVVDKEPVAIQNSFLRTPHILWQFRTARFQTA